MGSKRIFLVTIGTRGDVQPLLSVAKQLLQQSQSPLNLYFYAHPEYVEFSKDFLPHHLPNAPESTVEFRHFEPSVQLLFQRTNFVKNPFFPQGDWKLAHRLLVSWYGTLLRDLRHDRPDIMITTFPGCVFFCHMDPILRETNTKHYVLALYPCLPTGLYAPPFLPTTPLFFLNLALWYLVFCLFHLTIGCFYLRKALVVVGVPQPPTPFSGSFLQYLNNGRMEVVGLFDPHLAGELAKSVHAQVVGYPISEPEGILDDNLKAIVASRNIPIVYVGFGSCIESIFATHREKLDFFYTLCRELTRVRREIPFKVIVHYGGTGIFHPELSATLQPTKCFLVNCLRETLASAFSEGEFLLIGNSTCHQTLFPHVDVVIHQGGSGVSHVAAINEVASVVFPGFPFIDQQLWGTRLESEGLGRCGESLLRFSKWPPGHIGDLLRRVLIDLPFHKANLAMLAERMKCADPCRRVFELLDI